MITEHPPDPGRRAPTRGEWQELLARFPSAPTELLERRSLRCRADSKFVLTPGAAAGLLPALAGHYAVLAVGARFVARYRTLYFDTAELAFFHAQRRDRRVRHKVRIRHYADRRVTMLEVKTRRSELETAKVWRERRYGDDVLSADDQAFVGVHTGVSHCLAPQVWTAFRRVTLLGLHANERITIDLDIRMGMGRRCRSLADVAIVEVKQWPFCRNTPAMGELRAGGWRPSGVSKYCAAIALTHPRVRHSRLLPDLRALTRAAA